MRRGFSPVVFVFAALAGSGCETVHGRAAPLGPNGIHPSSGPVYVHTVTSLPPGLAHVGMVSATGAGEDATVDVVLAELVRQAQRLGATHVAVDYLRMNYQWVPSYSSGAFMCGRSMMCGGMYQTYGHEISTLVAHGRAFRPGPPADAAPAGGGP